MQTWSSTLIITFRLPYSPSDYELLNHVHGNGGRVWFVDGPADVARFSGANAASHRNPSSSRISPRRAIREAFEPSYLGLGAKIAPKVKVTISTDPIERKLHAKLDGEKKRAAKIQEESNTAKKNEEHSDDEDCDQKSRTNAFVRKKAIFVATSLQPKKKHK